MNTASEFRCASCGGTFEKGWTEEEAVAESDALFPGVSADKMSVVCDGCFQRLLGQRNLLRPDFRQQYQQEPPPPRRFGDRLRGHRADGEMLMAALRYRHDRWIEHGVGTMEEYNAIEARVARLLDFDALATAVDADRDEIAQEAARLRKLAADYLGTAISLGGLRTQEQDAALGRELIEILAGHCGETGRSEGAVETLRRIINERSCLLARDPEQGFRGASFIGRATPGEDAAEVGALTTDLTIEEAVACDRAEADDGEAARQTRVDRADRVQELYDREDR